jgi:hypothetical protein
MYKRTLLITTVLVCVTILAAVMLHEQGHRYDIVAVAAGAGGSTEDKGDAVMEAWLIDHKTGEISKIIGNVVVRAKKIDQNDQPSK